jgi:nucleotide-binding universal stress UspA family protein
MGNERMTILVGIDFSETAARAFTWAVAMARRFAGRVELVHIGASSVTAPIELADASLEGLGDLVAAERYLGRLGAVAAAASVPCRVHLRLGHPVEGLLGAIGDLEPDLVVLGSHGRGAVMRALMGTVSEAVWRRSPVPTVIIPGSEPVATAVDDAAREAAPERAAWSCSRCGHIRGARESITRCGRCGLLPAAWEWALVEPGPVDAAEAAVGEPIAGDEPALRTTHATAGLFSTSPPGSEGYGVNPELRVRY